MCSKNLKKKSYKLDVRNFRTFINIICKTPVVKESISDFYVAT